MTNFIVNNIIFYISEKIQLNNKSYIQFIFIYPFIRRKITLFYVFKLHRRLHFAHIPLDIKIRVK